MTTLHPHTSIAVPLGSTFGAWLFLGAVRALDALRGLRRQPVLRSEMPGRVVEANRLRWQAQALLSIDPRVAADLFAAADRHERME